MLPIPVGSTAVVDVVVRPDHTVDFDELGKVHPVYATYTMAKHFEEAGRKLLLRHLEPGEAGIGRSVSVEHLAPSWVGDVLRVTDGEVAMRRNYALEAEEVEAGYVLTCQSVPVSDAVTVDFDA